MSSQHDLFAYLQGGEAPGLGIRLNQERVVYTGWVLSLDRCLEVLAYFMAIGERNIVALNDEYGAKSLLLILGQDSRLGLNPLNEDLDTLLPEVAGRHAHPEQAAWPRGPFSANSESEWNVGNLYFNAPIVGERVEIRQDPRLYEP
jgi:hypothetical protein